MADGIIRVVKFDETRYQKLMHWLDHSASNFASPEEEKAIREIMDFIECTSEPL